MDIAQNARFENRWLIISLIVYFERRVCTYPWKTRTFRRGPQCPKSSSSEFCRFNSNGVRSVTLLAAVSGGHDPRSTSTNVGPLEPTDVAAVADDLRSWCRRHRRRWSQSRQPSSSSSSRATVSYAAGGTAPVAVAVVTSMTDILRSPRYNIPILIVFFFFFFLCATKRYAYELICSMK